MKGVGGMGGGVGEGCKVVGQESRLAAIVLLTCVLDCRTKAIGATRAYVTGHAHGTRLLGS
jgi:hypothetical protein